MARRKKSSKNKGEIFCSTGETVVGYENYLRTNHWRLRRQRIANYHNHLCQGCGIRVEKGFHIHHLTYRNIGNELDSDLAFLCEKCHNDLHAKRIKIDFKKQADAKQTEVATTSDEIKQRTKEYYERMAKYDKPEKQPTVSTAKQQGQLIVAKRNQIKQKLLKANLDQLLEVERFIENLLHQPSINSKAASSPSKPIRTAK